MLLYKKLLLMTFSTTLVNIVKGQLQLYVYKEQEVWLLISLNLRASELLLLTLFRDPSFYGDRRAIYLNIPLIYLYFLLPFT
jgi:hypothetical protein